VAEVFGDAATAVGMGGHAFSDPDLREEFAAESLPIDVARFHTYGVGWRPGHLAFTVDGGVVRVVEQAPAYPMQLMLGVFDFSGQGRTRRRAGPRRLFRRRTANSA